MRKRLLLFVVVASFALSSNAQPYIYQFNNDLTETGAVGPTLAEVLQLGCVFTPVNGNFTTQSITNPCGAPRRLAFNFTQGGGFSFDNLTTPLLASEYTVSILFKFNNPSDGNFKRVVDFSDGTRDAGIYVGGVGELEIQGGTLTVTGSYTFDPNTFAYLTIVRAPADNLLSVYIDGQPYATLDITGGGDPYETGNEVIFFKDDNSGPCDDGDGTVSYISVDPAILDASQVLAQYQGLCATSVLPVQMVGFAAVKQGNSVMLKWATESEINSNHFELERSTDGRSFAKLASVNAANNSSIRINYSYLDAQPVQGTGFYRLKMVDNDGHSKYSSILKVSFGGITRLQVFPNPARDIVTISGIQANQTIRLINAHGVQMAQLRSTGESMTMDMNKYPSGIYILVYSDGQTIQRQKIVKE